jgi:two-component system chemotaxis response regulator CheB
MTNIAVRIKAEVIGIGISTGGPNALAAMLPLLRGDIDVPILIVQHMPPLFTKSLAASLDAKSALTVKEGEDGETIKNNVVYIAPGGRQMKVTLGANAATKIIRVTDDPPENNCKPSVDYLFRSLAHHYVGRSTGVIMTGMGNDGTLGLRLMKRSGAAVIAQDEASSVVFGMPKEAIEAGVVDIVAPLDKIAGEIMKTVKH